MKKILVAIFTSLSLVAISAPVEVARIRVADMASIIKAANKIGEMTKNPFLGAMISAQVAQNEFFSFPGEMRDNIPFVVSFLYESNKISQVTKDITDNLSIAFLYPIKDSKTVLENHSKAVLVSDGIYSLKDEEKDVFEDCFFAFTPDKKWLVVSEEKTNVMSAISFKLPESKLSNGTLISLELDEKNIERLATILSNLKDDNNKEVVPASDVDTIKSFFEFNSSIKIDSKGVSFEGCAKPRADSKYAKTQEKAISEKLFNFAGTNAVCAQVISELEFPNNPIKVADKILEVFAKNKVKTDFLSFKRGENLLCTTLDLPALIKYANTDGKKEFSKLDPKAFVAELRATALQGEKVTEPTVFYTSFGIKGYSSKTSLNNRFSNIIPEAKGKYLTAASVASVYSLLKISLPSLLVQMNPAMAAQSNALLSSLPPENNGGFAMMRWRENTNLYMLSRISADEISAIGSSVNVVMALVMANSLQAADQNDDDDE